MDKCLECGADLIKVEGKRQKVYCNSNCRAKNYQKVNKGKGKYVQLSKYEKLLEENAILKSQINNPNNKQQEVDVINKKEPIVATKIENPTSDTKEELSADKSTENAISEKPKFRSEMQERIWKAKQEIILNNKNK